MLIYLDSDLFFFGDSTPLYVELGDIPYLQEVGNLEAELGEGAGNQPDLSLNITIANKLRLLFHGLRERYPLALVGPKERATTFPQPIHNNFQTA
jgi:hypothetical protein